MKKSKYILTSTKIFLFSGIIFLPTLLDLAHARSENFAPTHLQKLESKIKESSQLSYQDLAHEFKGCPENSLCSKSMGERHRDWLAFIKRPEARKIDGLEKRRKSHGLPLHFYTTEKWLHSLDPIAYGSRCEQHNLKGQDRIFKATLLAKNLLSSDSIDLDDVQVAHPKGVLKFKLPVEERPIMLADQKLIIAMNSEDLFYYMAVDQKGNWQVISPNSKDIKQAMLSRQTLDCPAEFKTRPQEGRSKVYCEEIWDKDLKRNVTVKLQWSCE